MFVRSDFSFDNTCPRDFVTSQWQRGSKSVAFLIHRWLLAIFFIGNVIASIFYVIEHKQMNTYLIYLTNWGLLMSMIMTILGAVLVTAYYFDKMIVQQNRIMPVVFKAYWFLSNTATVIAFGITILYWSLIYEGQQMSMNIFLRHIANSLALVLDLLIIKHPARFLHFIYPIMFGTFYLMFTVIFTLLGGINKYGQNYVYPVIDWRNKPARSVSMAIFTIVFVGIVHCLVTFIHRLRHRRYSKSFELTEDVRDIEL